MTTTATPTHTLTVPVALVLNQGRMEAHSLDCETDLGLVMGEATPPRNGEGMQITAHLGDCLTSDSRCQTTEDLPVRWEKGRDDYGRSVHYLHQGSKTLGAVVAIPRRTAPALGYTHIANDWTVPATAERHDHVTEHQSLQSAKAWLLARHQGVTA